MKHLKLIASILAILSFITTNVLLVLQVESISIAYSIIYVSNVALLSLLGYGIFKGVEGDSIKQINHIYEQFKETIEVRDQVMSTAINDLKNRVEKKELETRFTTKSPANFKF